jgi:glycerate 2-kinase
VSIVLNDFEPNGFLRSLFERAVAVADPMAMIASHLPAKPKGKLIIVGAGKASARMAEAVEAAWGPCDGLVITRYGYGRPTKRIEIVEAAHPVPDEAGLKATARMGDMLSGLQPDDFVLALMSGGASALLVSPAGGISLSEKQAVNSALLASGAPIGEMNVVRKHLSNVKGGRLAAMAYPATMLSLMISDVPGDDPALIGSGPTVGDTSTPEDVQAILQRWAIKVPRSLQTVLNGGNTVIAPDDVRLSKTENRVVAAPLQSLEAAAALAREVGCDVRILGDRIEGEARDLAKAHAEQALHIQAELPPKAAPVLLLSGGELTVTRRGDGIGGPNAEYMLAMAIALNSAQGIYALACDTDGVDGAAEIAGAVIGPKTLEKAKAAGLSPAEALARNDAHSFFAAIKDQVITGPTLTNVNDFRALLIQAT